MVAVASSEKLQEQMNSQKTGLHNPSTLPNSSIFFKSQTWRFWNYSIKKEQHTLYLHKESLKLQTKNTKLFVTMSRVFSI